jgi:hypothetical protein
MGTPIYEQPFPRCRAFRITLNTLRSLKELPGTWVGKGFNLVALPNGCNANQPLPLFLKLSITMETLTVTKIGRPIPNRGWLQDDMFFVGMHHFQQLRIEVAAHCCCYAGEASSS